MIKTPTLCHLCRYIRPMHMMRVDEGTHDLLHNPKCPLPGGLFVCDSVPCGSPDGATAKLGAGAHLENV